MLSQKLGLERREAELIRTLQRNLINPEGQALLELLQVHLAWAKDRLVRAAPEHFQSMQGQAQYIEHLIKQITIPTIKPE